MPELMCWQDNKTYRVIKHNAICCASGPLPEVANGTSHTEAAHLEPPVLLSQWGGQAMGRRGGNVRTGRIEGMAGTQKIGGMDLVTVLHTGCSQFILKLSAPFSPLTFSTKRGSICPKRPIGCPRSYEEVS